MLDMNMLEILKEISSGRVKHNTIIEPFNKNESTLIYSYNTLFYYFNDHEENETYEVKVEDLLIMIESNHKYYIVEEVI